jgi:transposase
VADLPPPVPGCEGCAARDREIAELRARVAWLERIVSRNSGNSSMPPSADDLPGRTPPSRQQHRAAQRAARKRGKQPGAPGSAMSWAEPDEVIDHHPRGVCGCIADLAQAADLGLARSCQQLEIPLMIARRVQHDLHAARCACGREHVATRPPGVPDAAVSIGPNLRALVVYLLVFQHAPVERCRKLAKDLTGAHVSAGFIHSCLAKTAEVIADVIKLIKTLFTAAYVAGFDETTLRAGPAGAKKYVPGAFTELYSVFFLGSRSLESFRDFGILPEFGGVVVSDRYACSFRDGWEHLAGRQACLAHIIRDFGPNAGRTRSGLARRSGRCAA